MATLQWDHAVQFVNQPEAAIEIFAGQQLRAVAGGRHPGWGTRNALSYFGLTYIEFLAIADPDELRARAISSAGGSSPSMATLPGWSIPLCCSGEKTTPPG